MDVEIANHSTLSATYSRFLIKNFQTDDIASIKKELEAAKKQNTKLEDRVKDLEAKVKAAQSVRALQNQMKGRNNNTLGNWELEKTLPQLAQNLLCEECYMVPKLELLGFDSWIVSEGWPSWAFSLQSLGCKHMKVSSKGLSLRELACLKGTSLRESIVPWQNLDWSMQDTWPNAQPKFMWIQGLEDFVTQAFDKAKENGFTAITVSIVANSNWIPTIDPMPQSSWYKMKHSTTVGGCTRGAWFVSSSLNLDLQALNASSTVQQTLHDILKSTVHRTA